MATSRSLKVIFFYLAVLPNSGKLVSMDARTLARYEVRSRVFKALAHPSRLLMVDELARSERCVCELTALVGSDMSTVSKHLSVLKAAGVVEDERRGTQIWYRLRMTCVIGFVGCVESELQRRVCEQLDLVQSGPARR
jgi:ArsR family transcriptional regulator